MQPSEVLRRHSSNEKEDQPIATANSALWAESLILNVRRKKMEIDHRPQLKVDDDLRALCREIVAKGKSAGEWDRLESDDMFQRGNYVGGYDAAEQRFTFSYYDAAKKEWWLSFRLPIAEKIARGDEFWLDLYEPS